MELKNTYALYICLAVVLVLFFITFLQLHRKERYVKGKKAVMPEYVTNDSHYKNKMIVYRILKVLTGGACIIGICASFVLLSRPFTEKTVKEEKYSRDIYLCMDISTSVDVLNEKLVDELRDVISELNGERLGVVIFNTTPIILCPLTDDYDYILSVFDKVEESLEARAKLFDEDSSIDDYDLDEYYELIRLSGYVSSGTVVGNEERGSSLIGDGLASAAYYFPNLKEDKERVRLIIFSTDNDIQGTPYVTLDEAGDICKANNIRVYGIGTKEMFDDDRVAMKSAIEKTGGSFYMEEESGTMAQIVDDINKQGLNLVEGRTYTVETEHPEASIIILVIYVVMMFVLIRFSKR